MRNLLPAILVVLLLSSCIQENNPRNIGLGDVTIGQQLIDLKLALDSESITQDEYDVVKKNLIAASTMCAESKTESDEDGGWFF